MQLTAELTKKDYVALRRFSAFRLRKGWLLYLVLGVYIAWSNFSVIDPAEYSLASRVSAALAVAVAAAGGAALFTLFLQAVLPNRPGTILGEHVFTLTDSEFLEKNAVASSSIKLEQLRRYETSNHVFLVTPTHTAFILPKRALVAAPEFVGMLAGKTRRA